MEGAEQTRPPGTLPVPFAVDGRVMRVATFGRPTAGAIADTRRRAECGDIFGAFAILVAAGIEELSGDGEPLTERSDLKRAARAMPYATANWCGVQILLGLGAEDTIDSYDKCPRCEAPWTPAEPERVRDLPVRYCEGDGVVDVVLKRPARLTSDRKALVTLESLRIHQPTLDECARAAQRNGFEDKTRLQLAVLAEAAELQNGQPVDAKWRNQWAPLLFDRLDVEDLRELSLATGSYGYLDVVERVCLKCGRRWEGEVDVTRFFASGLRSPSASVAAGRSG